jgi:hypothetical protein
MLRRGVVLSIDAFCLRFQLFVCPLAPIHERVCDGPLINVIAMIVAAEDDIGAIDSGSIEQGWDQARRVRRQVAGSTLPLPCRSYRHTPVMFTDQ